MCTSWSHRTQTAKLVEVYVDSDEFHHCTACGHPVTSDGEPIGYVDPGGTWRGKIIVLEAEEAKAEDAPEEAAV